MPEATNGNSTNALTVINPETGVPVRFQSIRNLDIDAIQAKLDAEMPDFPSVFPGDPLTFDGKRGKWRWGHGKKGIAFDHTAYSFVFNIPHAVEGWQRFVEDPATGKLRPLITGMVAICDPDARLPSRSALGDTDEELWPTDAWGKKTDPWKHFIAIPLRTAGSGQVNHLFVSTISSVIAVKGLIRDFIDNARDHMGQLPVVNLGTETRPNKHGEDFDAPVFKIVEWEAPIPVDEPDPSEQAAAAEPIPEATVTQVGRPSAQQTVDGRDEFGFPTDGRRYDEQTVVSNLEAQANRTAAAERDAISNQVRRVAQTAGATTPNAGQAPKPDPALSGLFGAGRRSAAPTGNVLVSSTRATNSARSAFKV